MAVPPEDKASSSSEKRVEQPIHSRDIWALGQLMLQSIEDIQSEGVCVCVGVYLRVGWKGQTS